MRNIVCLKHECGLPALKKLSPDIDISLCILHQCDCLPRSIVELKAYIANRDPNTEPCMEHYCPRHGIRKTMKNGAYHCPMEICIHCDKKREDNSPYCHMICTKCWKDHTLFGFAYCADCTCKFPGCKLPGRDYCVKHSNHHCIQCGQKSKLKYGMCRRCVCPVKTCRLPMDVFACKSHQCESCATRVREGPRWQYNEDVDGDSLHDDNSNRGDGRGDGSDNNRGGNIIIINGDNRDNDSNDDSDDEQNTLNARAESSKFQIYKTNGNVHLQDPRFSLPQHLKFIETQRNWYKCINEYQLWHEEAASLCKKCNLQIATATLQVELPDIMRLMMKKLNYTPLTSFSVCNSCRLLTKCEECEMATVDNLCVFHKGWLPIICIHPQCYNTADKVFGFCKECAPGWIIYANKVYIKSFGRIMEIGSTTIKKFIKGYMRFKRSKKHIPSHVYACQLAISGDVDYALSMVSIYNSLPENQAKALLIETSDSALINICFLPADIIAKIMEFAYICF